MLAHVPAQQQGLEDGLPALMGRRPSNLLLSPPSRLAHIAWPLRTLEFINLFDIFRLVFSIGDSSWDFDTLEIFKESVNLFHQSFNCPHFPKTQ